jgi:hypothetical protein
LQQVLLVLAVEVLVVRQVTVLLEQQTQAVVAVVAVMQAALFGAVAQVVQVWCLSPFRQQTTQEQPQAHQQLQLAARTQ